MFQSPGATHSFHCD